MDNHRLVKFTLNLANWCRDSNLPINELNINRYLAMRGSALSKIDIMRIYDLMLPEADPYSLEPTTIHVRRKPQYWVPAKSNNQCVTARRIYMGSSMPYGLFDGKPNFISQHLVDEHIEWMRKQKIRNAKEIEETTKHDQRNGPRKTTIVLSTMWID